MFGCEIDKIDVPRGIFALKAIDPCRLVAHGPAAGLLGDRIIGHRPRCFADSHLGGCFRILPNIHGNNLVVKGNPPYCYTFINPPTYE